MGRQTEFYMSAADEREFLGFAASDREVVILNDTSLSEALPVLAELPGRKADGWFQVFLWDRDHSPAPIMIPLGKGTRHYLTTDSEVVEFHRSIVDEEGRLTPGRIWADMRALKDGTAFIDKGEPFQRWFSRLATWIRRHAARREHERFVMPGAAEFAQQGGRLRSY